MEFKKKEGNVKKKGFFSKIIEMIDRKMEEKSKKSSCCRGDAKKGSSCC